MHASPDSVYCLGCRASMPASDNVCPTCQADQAVLRSQRMATAAKATARTAPVQPPPVMAPSGPIQCEKCKVTSPADSKSCSYCGHSFMDPKAQHAFEVGNSKWYVGIGILFAIAALIFSPIYCALGGVVFGFVAQAECERNQAGMRVVILNVVCGFLGIVIRFLLAGHP